MSVRLVRNALLTGVLIGGAMILPSHEARAQSSCDSACESCLGYWGEEYTFCEIYGGTDCAQYLANLNSCYSE